VTFETCSHGGARGNKLDRVTAALLDLAPAGVCLAPCPQFVRGREVSADAVAHAAFVGHAFKDPLLPV